MNRASAQERLEEWVKASPGAINFAARTIADDRLVGGIGLMDINHADGNAQLGLSIYQQDDWGQGYGREMIVLALRYAFNELNLHRVWLTTSAFNERALKLYEKLGFRHEGRGREHSCWTAAVGHRLHGDAAGRVRGLARPARRTATSRACRGTRRRSCRTRPAGR